MSATLSAPLALLTLLVATVHQAPGVEATSVNEVARAFAGLRGSTARSEEKVAASAQPSEDSIVQTLKALDTDGDGKVGKNEIESFAKSQGLSAEEVRADFADLDRNGDGELEASEIGTVLTETEGDAESASHEVKAKRNAVFGAPKPKAASAITKVPKAAKAAPELEALPEPETVQLDMIAEEQPVLESKEQPRDELNMLDLQKNAERQAGSVLAETLARQAQQMFQQGQQDEKRAQEFEKLAKQLRSNITALARSANADTKLAAREATAKVGKGAIAEVRALRQKSEEVEQSANERRKQAKAAMQRVLKAQEQMAAQTRLLSAGI